MCYAECRKQIWVKRVSCPQTSGTFCVSSFDTMIALFCEVRSMVQEYTSIDGVLKQLKCMFSLRYDFVGIETKLMSVEHLKL
jgi:hypothetical protein